ncbi:MAG: tetrahydromethanopterin S-methyltransferase subunit MtrG [Candidatus Bathyarchaeota archaeon]
MLKEENVEKSVNPEIAVPLIITPPEIFELYKKLDEVDERVEFVLGELAQKEGVKIGSNIGFLWGFIIGTIACIILKFVLHLL